MAFAGAESFLKKSITYTEFAVPKVILASVTTPGLREGISGHAM